jgi:hypothetical protein
MTGIRKMAMKLAASMPPMTVKPMTCLDSAPAPLALANGTHPRMNAKLVIKIGRNRSLAPSSVASSNGLP